MTSTPDPWAPDTPQLLTGVLSHRPAARIVTAAGEALELDLTDGTVAFDERQAPRVQAQLVAKVPADVAILGRMDPRAGCRLAIDAGYRRPDGSLDVHTLADLSLRKRPVTRPDNRMAVVGWSDESLVIDAAACVTGTLSANNTINAIAAVVGQVLPAATFTFTAAGGPAVNQSQVDTDRWDTIADLADRIGAQVFADEARRWHIDAVPVLGTPALSVAHGKAGTLVSSEADVSRDDGWANWVTLRYLWTDASNVRQRIVASRRIQTGPYAAVAGNTKIYLEERDTPTTQAQADAAAASLVARMVTRGRSLSITTPSAYWVRPGDTVTVQLPTGDAETHLVASVEFDLRTGLMDVTTRLPDNTGTIGA